MKVYDQGSSLFWLLSSVFVFIESNRLGIGTLQNPETGFISFGLRLLWFSRRPISSIVFLSGAEKSPFHEHCESPLVLMPSSLYKIHASKLLINTFS
jgi:hypothetical protein